MAQRLQFVTRQKKKNKNEEGDNYLDEINEKLSCKGSKSTKRT